ncbi:MAG: sigma-70 family RNA polymerase sigma factor [Oscillospiraceae bacterium]|nr:sigma-70 family RNA polymerase sigma factor [Oscillospiraceae bacterium]
MLNYCELDDSELRRLAFHGDKNAEEQLVLRYMRTVRACARPYFLAGGDGEDLIQEGMFGLLSAIRRYDEDREASFKSYAETCIKNRIISAVKSAASVKHLPLNDFVPIESLQSDESQISLLASGLNRKTPEEQVLASESEETSKSFYSSFVKQLSKLEKTVLNKYLCGLSYREIARETGKSEKAIDNAIQRIRRKLALRINSGDFSIS